MRQFVYSKFLQRGGMKAWNFEVGLAHVDVDGGIHLIFAYHEAVMNWIYNVRIMIGAVK